jgi:hypothetical protein
MLDWPLVFIFLARTTTSITADLSYLLLGAYVLMGRQQIIKGLFLVWLFGALHPGIFPQPSNAALGRYLVFGLAVVSVLLSGSLRRATLLTCMTCVFTAFLLLHSVAVSIIPEVSILKAASWGAVFVTVFASWSAMNTQERLDTLNWITRFLLAIAVISLPLLLVPSLGYMRTLSGFQGVLSHPQIFGPIMAVLGGLAAGKLIDRHSHKLFNLVLLFLALFLVVLSGTRTAGLALILGILMSAVVKIFVSALQTGQVFRLQKGALVFWSGFLFISSVAFLGSQQTDVISSYLNKYDGERTRGLVEIYMASRSVLYLPMIDNIAENLVGGIGFGIASVPSSMNIIRDPIFGFPISASIEKGVLPLAVFEEIGFLGFSIWVLWIIVIIYQAIKVGATALTVILVVLLLNLGESVLFSVGGMGLFQILIISGVITADNEVKFYKEEN